MERHLLAILRELPDLPGGVVASARLGHLHLHQLVPLQAGHSLAVPAVSRPLLELLAQLELDLGVLEAGQGL